MNHETYREQLALRLYGELTEEEGRALERHLDGCEACAALARELSTTLGGLVANAPDPRALPADWSERLRAATRAVAPRRRVQPVASFVGGLAAGLFLAFLLTPRDAGHGARTEPGVTIHTNAGEGPSFTARATPPPQTTSTGTLSRLPELMRR